MRPHFDDIVVGAGAAGTVLAARLSEDPARRVLLIEAGPDYPRPSALPPDLSDGRTPSMVRHDWSLTGVRDDGTPLPLPRGKVVGGSSAVNACVALRPHPAEFAGWARAGVRGWSWREVLPYFTGLESDADFTDPHHGAEGPLPVRRTPPDEYTPLSAALVDTATAAGHPPVADHNAPGARGVGPLPLNLTPDGRRISTATAYLGPARGRPSLTVLADTLADRVVFDGTTARGVLVHSPAGPRELHGDRITVCAGAYGTPALLHRSGLGPARLLRALGVPPVADLPGLGAGLADHSQVAIGIVPQPGPGPGPGRPGAGAGPCAQVLLSHTAPGSAIPGDLQLYALNHVELAVYAPRLAASVPGGRAFMLTSNLMAPESRGTVEAVSRDPAVPPRIAIDYGRERADLDRQRAGLRLCWELLHQPAFTALTKDVIDMDEATIRSSRLLDAHIRRAARTAHHPMGTARIGRSGDPLAVVDDRCRVHGVRGLLIADASVIPAPVRVNTHLISIVIAERAAAWAR
ncbi:GMC family oxidoreductase [Streptomyces katsurahamanus]|uniref:Glucose-methanol-choline oxidoreductase n=1 Tax=Streptomyces katsurahamanus TaxID=2577098 RepID=A0ABW9NZ03_9ACTN|nr:GMC family oxidoreductase N-terminal domain-containing protein [Streptomyces katsurahamanus]MQS38537.1 glucose-methanol-choline oxidoreductase [Streptomyces katsurahamanus]